MKLTSPVKYLRHMVRKIRFNLYLLEGEERASKKDLSLLFIGSGAGSGAEKTYLAELAFSGDYRETLTGKTWIWGLRGVLKQQLADMVIVANIGPRLYRFLSGRGDFYIPNWLRGEIVLSDAQAKMKSSGHVKSDLRRIRKNDLEFEVTRSSSRFDNFYHTMYLPHIEKQFGQTAMPMAYERMKVLESTSELLLVTQQGEPLAGQILVYEDDRVRCWSIGVKDGNHDYIKMGAQAALYRYEVQYLSERGYKAMHVGASRPFLKDGVLRFKNKWGMRLLDATSKGFMLKPLRKSEGALSFLVNNPFIECVNGEYVGIVFAEAGAESDNGQDTSAQYRSFGLSGLMIYTDTGGEENSTAPKDAEEGYTLVSTDTLF